MDIRFGDHPSFHRAAAGMVGGSLLAGIALHFLTRGSGAAAVSPLLGGLAGIAAGAAWAYGKPIWRVFAVGLAAVPLLAMALAWPALTVAGAAIALGLAIGGRNGATDRKGLLAVGLALGTMLLAMWCALRVDTARETISWPGWLTDGVAAAAMGMVAVLAMLPRHLTLTIDPVHAAVRQLPATLDPEVRRLCARSVAIWDGTKQQLADDDTGLHLVRDGVLKALEVAVKSSEVKVTGPSEAELAARMTDLDARIAAATDAEVVAQYTAARAALDDQHRYRRHIANGRERLVARMHNHVAALEKFQLAATGLPAARATSSSSTAVRQLAELSSDVAASGEALAEVDL